MLTKFLWALCILLKSLVYRMYGKKILAITIHRLAIPLGEIRRVASHLTIMQCIYKCCRHLRWRDRRCVDKITTINTNTYGVTSSSFPPPFVVSTSMVPIYIPIYIN
jgi:hypothetical protein